MGIVANRTAELPETLNGLVRLTVRLGCAYIDAVDPRTAVAQLRRIIESEAEAAMGGVADEGTRDFIFKLTDDLKKYAAADPHTRRPVRAPILPGGRRR